MKYAVDITINRSREVVVSKFDNAENLKHWMPGLQRFDHLEGEAGQAGAKSKILFVNGKRRIEMTETIEENKLPDFLSAYYDASGVHNKVTNRFEVIDKNTTRVINEQEFKMKSLGMQFFALILPGMFKKQSMTYLKALKAFVEEGASVAEKRLSSDG